MKSLPLIAEIMIFFIVHNEISITLEVYEFVSGALSECSIELNDDLFPRKFA